MALDEKSESHLGVPSEIGNDVDQRFGRHFKLDIAALT
jgi:hypothetical protein